MADLSKQNLFYLLKVASCFLLVVSPPAPALGLPPPDDTPEEILRTEIITSARSPIDGQPLTPAEYAQLQDQLPPTDLPVRPGQERGEARAPTGLAPDDSILNKLPIRELLRQIFPF